MDERERYAPYQSEDPSPTIPTDRQEEEQGKIVEDYSRDRAAWANKKSIGPALETNQSHPIEYGVSKLVLEGHCERNENLRYCEVLQLGAAEVTDVQPEHRV